MAIKGTQKKTSKVKAQKNIAKNPLLAKDLGLPKFSFKKLTKAPLSFDGGGAQDATLFHLSSHERARQALEFGLRMSESKFNIFVVGDDKSGRMRSTRAFLEAHTKNFPLRSDWIYVNNFKQPHIPRPFELPPGYGKKFCKRLRRSVNEIKETLPRLFTSPEYSLQVQSESGKLEDQIKVEVENLKRFSNSHGLDLQHGADGALMVVLLAPEGEEPKSYEQLTEAEKKEVDSIWKLIKHELNQITHRAREGGEALSSYVEDMRRNVANFAITPLIDDLKSDFSGFCEIGEWIDSLKEDILDNLHLFLEEEEANEKKAKEKVPLQDRYAVNLLVDHSEDRSGHVVLEPNPTYENLFGSIKYKSSPNGYETNFTMIHAGALHCANGGVLILRVDAIAHDLDVWSHLKAALRDGEIRIEELYRVSGIPVLEAPEPEPIPLNIKIILVGAPWWYNSFFYMDPEFQSYFQIKADIDSELLADSKNLPVYAHLIEQFSKNELELSCNPSSIKCLLGHASRWASNRKKLTSQFEHVEELLVEAATYTKLRNGKSVSVDDIKEAFEGRRLRNARFEDRYQEDLHSGHLMIDTKGSVVGQANALTVLETGGYSFGVPSRVSAQVSAGEHGVINIERMVEMSGPIQQKGVLELEGFLNGTFGQKFPLSFSCFVTFEQNYSEVEGDSASLAEVCTILSALSGCPIRQNIAITGSINQLGQTQVVGGINQKIEGFYKACKSRGFTGDQGVLLPEANRENIILKDELVQDIKKGNFHIWTAKNIKEAIETLTGVSAGSPKNLSNKDTIFGKVYAKLESYDKAISNRLRGR
ncbi:MAG: AAA family ATPase [Alphaproteobacteria bacterium]|nr:AAA family ATPase [Alphaproteobacteria bacterium]MBT5655144.1 AAA family ATPase [Alphaproteobacteria bacterium]